MHTAAVVVEDQLIGLPMMPVVKLRLVDMGIECIQQVFAFSQRQSGHIGVESIAQKEKQFAGERMTLHDIGLDTG
ncbi:hypothetical protein D3C71_2029520 [compost metagenome]